MSKETPRPQSQSLSRLTWTLRVKDSLDIKAWDLDFRAQPHYLFSSAAGFSVALLTGLAAAAIFGTRFTTGKRMSSG